MKQQYANDSQLILKIQGLRMLSKEDMIYSMGNKTTYRLRWEYKGSSGYMDYEKAKDRDNMFNEIVTAISQKRRSNMNKGFRKLSEKIDLYFSEVSDAQLRADFEKAGCEFYKNIDIKLFSDSFPTPTVTEKDQL